jgi:hypothetical protein
MSHFTKPPAKIGTPGSAGKLATARIHSTAGSQQWQDRQQQHVRKEQQKRQQHHWLHQERQQ